MFASIKLLLVLTTAGSLVNAHPQPTAAPDLAQRAIDCAKVNGALSVLKKAGPPATSFCSSYLRIPATKVSTTRVVATSITTTATTTIVTTQALCPRTPPKKRDGYIEHRGVGGTKLAYVPVKEAEKRGDILALLAAFAAAKVSEGCSCLNIQPRATTTTTFTTSTTTIKVQATTTACSEQPAACIPLGELCPFGGTPNRCCAGKCTGIVADADPAICFISSGGK